MTTDSEASGRTDPVRTGVVLGLVLFASILLTGQGLGASGAYATAAAAAMHAIAPAHTAGSKYLSTWVPEDGLFGSWIVVELLAVMAGAWLSARFSRRHSGARPDASDRLHGGRTGRVVVGGILMGAGARLAHGCTSGLGLTGGALMATGAWLFIPVAFATAFVVAWLQRRVTE